MRRVIIGVFAAAGMLVLIMDAQTALGGAAEGVILCVRSVIPSLLPFFVLSTLLTGSLSGQQVPGLSALGRLCAMPAGSESILISGLLGGYPAGAQAVCESYRTGQLSPNTAQRMLGFCNNAGPSFIFGMVAGRFHSSAVGWWLWGIQIASCILTAIILPGKCSTQAVVSSAKPVTVPGALQGALRAMALVCGWVILFRVLIAVLNRWVMWLLPTSLQAAIAGLLELTNGCFQLPQIEQEAVRFLLASAMLSFGGICVAMQTASVAGSLGLGMYLPGKCLQTAIALALAAIISPIIFGVQVQWTVLLIAVLFVAGFSVFLWKSENNGSIPMAIGV